jgi:hypothetical protein
MSLRARTIQIVFALLGLTAGVVGWARDAEAARFAILVGNNNGQAGDPPLRFAERDTAHLADILTRIGGFTPSTTVVLRARAADELRRAIADLSDRLRATPGEHLALVFYSGHADAQALRMKASSFSVAELREALKALPAAARVLIVDACQAGVLTRPKSAGPAVGLPLTIVPGAGEPTRGIAILAASAGSELAQESDVLEGSVFTHYLKIGLAGLADRNHDGEVSLSELFDYTADRTLAATMTTTTGPQHPTFRVDLTGRDDLILTRPGLAGAGYGQLRLDVPGWYFVRRADGTVAAEVVSRGGEALALDPGGYEITRRERHGLQVSVLEIRAGAAAPISGSPTRSVAYGQLVRKGGGGTGAPIVAYGLGVAATLRTPLADLGPSTGAAVAGRADLRAVSIELRLTMGRALHQAPHLSVQTWDVSASAAVLRAHDIALPWHAAGLTVAWGLDAGVAHVVQLLDDGDRRRSWSPCVGPLTTLDLRLGRRLFVRTELRAALHALRLERAGGTEVVWRPTLTSAIGAGVSF